MGILSGMDLHQAFCLVLVATLLLSRHTCYVAAAGEAVLQQGPSAEAVLKQGLSTVHHWLAEHQSELSCDWLDATLMAGVGVLQQATGSSELRDAMLAYGERHAWQLCVTIGHGEAWNPDNQLCAATYAQLYLTSEVKNGTWIAAAADHLDAEIANAASVRNWIWLDCLYMSMSVYARIGAITGNRAYYDKMHANFMYAANGHGLWSPADGLWHRDPPAASADGAFWGRGNGWAAAAIVQALQFSPVDDPHLETYRSFFVAHMAHVAALQGRDGCWRSALTAPGAFPTPETTATALFTYAIAYGIKAGLLEPAVFTPIVHASWQCLTSVSLHPDGSIGNCQPVGQAPDSAIGANSTSSFCVGQFAMAAAAYAQLL